jgi:polyisoprenoid-binding protein YceI
MMSFTGVGDRHRPGQQCRGHRTGAVTGGGAAWSARNGHVTLDLSNNKINFGVQGLVLAAGNSIGTPGTVTQVKGTVVCDTNGSAGGNSVVVDTPLVDLDEQGDAEFSSSLLSELPQVCATEPDIAFLVRIGVGKWIANGTVLR